MSITSGPTAVCDSCRKQFKIKTERRPAEDGITEVGVSCPHCNKWFLSFFDNDDLAKGREKLESLRKAFDSNKKDARSRKKYNKAAVAFQNKFNDLQRQEKDKRGLPVGGST